MTIPVYNPKLCVSMMLLWKTDHYRLRAMGFCGILIGMPENNGIHDVAHIKHGLCVGEKRN